MQAYSNHEGGQEGTVGQHGVRSDKERSIESQHLDGKGQNKAGDDRCGIDMSKVWYKCNGSSKEREAFARNAVNAGQEGPAEFL
jgi:hypothetical protein